MTLRPLDFQGMITLDKALFEQLGKYLTEKELELSLKMSAAFAIKGSTGQPQEGQKAQKPEGSLQDAIDHLGKEVRRASSSENEAEGKISSLDLAASINAHLWDYVETLEGFATELFQLLHQIKCESWDRQLLDSLRSIKDLLVKRIEDLSWGIKRIEKHLWQYRFYSPNGQKGALRNLRRLIFWRGCLDPALLSNLKKSEEYLNFGFKSFLQKFEQYESAGEKLDRSMLRFDGYLIFSNLEEQSREKFRRLYRLLKLWKISRQQHDFLGKEPTRLIRGFITQDKALNLFKTYFDAISSSLFEESRQIKEVAKEKLAKSEFVKESKERIEGYRKELTTLGSTCLRYKEFLLRTDPDPYVRSRWGFTEWVVGEEPDTSRKLTQLSYDMENLDNLYERMLQSLDAGLFAMKGNRLQEIKKGIQKCLHEMGQPLISRHMMQTRAESLLSKLEEIDELGSFKPEIVDYVGKVLSKSLRLDWKYHVLQGFSLFHKLYSIHIGIAKGSTEKEHKERIVRLEHSIQEISKWVRAHEVIKHDEDIRRLVKEINQIVADFHASCALLSENKSLDKKNLKDLCTIKAQELLEYRYLFGGFFFFLEQNDPDQELDRKQLMSAYQTFETVEQLLYAYRKS